MMKAEPPVGFAQWGLAWKQLMTWGLSILPGRGQRACAPPYWPQIRWLCCVDGTAVLLSVLLGFASEGSVFPPLLPEVMGDPHQYSLCFLGFVRKLLPQSP